MNWTKEYRSRHRRGSRIAAHKSREMARSNIYKQLYYPGCRVQGLELFMGESVFVVELQMIAKISQSLV